MVSEISPQILTGTIAERLSAVIHERAAALYLDIVALEVMPDHVHLFVKAPPTLVPQHTASQLKGYTALVLRDEFPQLRNRLPSLCSRSYYVGSAGAVSADTIQRYIEQQKRS